ncbi:MAG: phosphoribosylglycinamide formyltransferase [Actinobacteria bacterium]|uniref:phosphoribosylglycinamide formyltransferase 1 n=1 Tax=freshwater metagenome TaxID=449393 RepID=A0A6J7DN96_9ZZZZ|nr:phosphoribosylglycinamide formyltransferase [Actinomycetota bacterium]
MQIAVMASGTGTILQSLIEAELPIALVIADRECAALTRAQEAQIATALVERGSFAGDFDRDAYTEQVITSLQTAGIDLVAMAGFGTILGPAIFDAFADRIINTHPSLLPDFKGWHAVDDALRAGVSETGCTVHIATALVDEGPILAQEALPIYEGETVARLHERIKEIERRLYPMVLRGLVNESKQKSEGSI